METNFRFSQFTELKDLVRLVTTSPAPFLQYIEKDGEHIYFIYIPSFGRVPMVYFVKMSEPIEKNYIIYNRFQDNISFSDKLQAAGQTISIPILKIAKTNIFEKFSFK